MSKKCQSWLLSGAHAFEYSDSRWSPSYFLGSNYQGWQVSRHLAAYFDYLMFTGEARDGQGTGRDEKMDPCPGTNFQFLSPSLSIPGRLAYFASPSLASRDDSDSGPVPVPKLKKWEKSTFSSRNFLSIKYYCFFCVGERLKINFNDFNSNSRWKFVLGLMGVFEAAESNEKKN